MKRIWHYPLFWCVVLTLVGFTAGMSVDHQIKNSTYGNPNHIVSGGSMEPTMYDGDRLIIRDIPKEYLFRHGDVVSFDWEGTNSVKRIVYLPGDVDEEGNVVQPGYAVVKGDNWLTENPPPIRLSQIKGLVTGIRYQRQQPPIHETGVQSYSDDGRIAEIRNQSVIVNGHFLATCEEVTNTNGGTALEWSKDRLIWASNHHVFLWDGENIRMVYDGDRFKASPDGEYVAIVQQTGLAVVGLQDSNPITFIRQGGFPIWSGTSLHYKLEYMEPGNWVSRKLDIEPLIRLKVTPTLAH